MKINYIQEIQNKNSGIIFIIKENRIWASILSSLN